MQLPPRAALLAADGTPLATGPGRISPTPDVAGAIAGELGPIPPAEAALYAAEGYPPGARVGLARMAVAAGVTAMAVAVLFARTGMATRDWVVSFVGDGGAMYSPQALWSAAHYRARVIFVVFNNRRYGVLQNVARSLGYANAVAGRFVGMETVDPAIDFA